MFLKLLKYDVTYHYQKNAVALALLSIICVIARLLSDVTNGNLHGAFVTIFVTTITLLSAYVIISPFVFTIVRYYRTTFGKEAVQMQMLPVKKSIIVLSQLLASGIQYLVNTTVLIFLFRLTIGFFPWELVTMLDMSNSNLITIPHGDSFVSMTIESFVPYVLIAMFMAYLLYTTIVIGAITMGHLFTSKRIVYSILFGIGLYILTEAMDAIFILFIAGNMSFTMSGITSFIISVTQWVFLTFGICYLLEKKYNLY